MSSVADTTHSGDVLVIGLDPGDELVANARAHGLRAVPTDDNPSAADIAAAGSIVVAAERFGDLPLRDLADHNVRVWIATGSDPWQPPLSTWAAALKRAIDLAVAAGFLLVASPLLAAVAVAIKAGSRGPILHSQTRLGVDGSWFRMYKFRTMRTNNDATQHQKYFEQFAQGEVAQTNGIYKIVDDPRVTRIGQLLRKYSIDEVPQFINVLRGEMSVVGPRPMLPREITVLDATAWQRLRVKPGITGLWQVSGRSRTTFETMIELDLAYWRDWSVRQELTILLRTPGALLRAETA